MLRAQAAGSLSAIEAIGSITPALLISASTRPKRLFGFGDQRLDGGVVGHVAGPRRSDASGGRN